MTAVTEAIDAKAVAARMSRVGSDLAVGALGHS